VENESAEVGGHFSASCPKKRLEADSENSTPNKTNHLRYTELGLRAIKK